MRAGNGVMRAGNGVGMAVGRKEKAPSGSSSRGGKRQRSGAIGTDQADSSCPGIERSRGASCGVGLPADPPVDLPGSGDTKRGLRSW